LHVRNATLTESEHRSLCAGKDSKVMAAPGAIGCSCFRPVLAPPYDDQAMILFPAIDLKDGRCVRLKRGEMAEATVFNDDPAAQARLFAAQGFSHLHIVDLNGAFAGRPINAPAVEAILAAVSTPVQLGGGIRTLDTIEAWLAKGVARVILGTVAVRDPGLVREACRRFPGRVAVGIDARSGKVAVEGWAQASELEATELARRFEGAGVAAVIYTDIDRDGVLTGLNLPATAALARAVPIPVIASGGLAGLEDIEALLRPEYRMIAGAIAGRALYDGRLDARAALSLIAQGRAA
jgi:phosphoribosylformimino-5-aminoimidazole carboxamide ribotide isomerase